MDWFFKNHVCGLNLAENHFVQVLLSKFSLYRHHDKVRLRIELSSKQPTIRRRESKEVVKRAIPNFTEKASFYQKKLDDILIHGVTDEFHFEDPDFVFRYASGGVLPVISLNNEDYYCLFYRDLDPIGWNIANGGSDSFEELINPFNAINRELQEELIIADPENKKLHLFYSGESDNYDFPEFKMATERWDTQFSGRNLTQFSRQKAHFAWQEGPDDLTVKFGGTTQKTLHGCFLNINALDFGIEVDQIVRINITNRLILLDGEIMKNRLINRPIGLFEVKSLHEKIRKRSKEFLPDLLFHSGVSYSKQEARRVIEEDYIASLSQKGFQDEKHITAWRDLPKKYNLCPVTSRMIMRNMAATLNAEGAIFISYASQDEPLARRLRSDLQNQGFQCFFAPTDMKMGDKIRRRLDEKIESCGSFLVLISEEALKSQWVEYEVESVLEKIRRTGTTRLLPLKLDQKVHEVSSGWAKYIRNTTNMIDFSDWQTPAQYQQSFNRLFRDLE